MVSFKGPRDSRLNMKNIRYPGRNQSAILSVLIAWLTLTLPLHASLMPVYEKLRQVDSEHFVFIYQASLAAQTPEIMRECEEVYALLTPVLRWEPRQKPIIMIADALDEHNGMAAVYPRPAILLYVAGASPGSSIYEPGHFLRRTLLHEFAHLISMDAQYGVSDFLKKIFGRVQPSAGDPLSLLLAICAAAPGTLAPTWYLEGLAIWAETEYSRQGRGRNSLADMIMRMPVADNRLLPPNQWDLALPEWPYGEAAYLYGMEVIKYAQQEAVANPAYPNLPGQLADSVAHSFLYFFDDRAKPVMDQSFNQMTHAAIDAETTRQQRRIQALKSMPITDLPRLTPERLQVAAPRFGPHGNGTAVYFSGHAEAGRDVIYRYDLASKTLARIPAARTEFDVTTLNTPATHDKIFYTRLNVVGRDRLWNELKCYDPAAQTVTLINRGGRYRYPAISPDGRKLAAIRNEAGGYVLIEVPLAEAGQRGREIVRATTPAFYSLVDPAYAPNNRWLVYVLAGDQGSRLQSLDLMTGREETVVDWPANIQSPVFHPSGNCLVFVSDRSGVYNLYRLPWPAGGEPAPMTHVLGGVFDPDFSRDGSQLALVGYDSYGYYLSVRPWESLPLYKEPLPVIKPDWPVLVGSTQLVAHSGPAESNSLGNPPRPERASESEESSPLRQGFAGQAGGGESEKETRRVTTRLQGEQEQESTDVLKLDSKPYHALPATRLDFWTPWLTVASGGAGVMGGLAASFSDYIQSQNLLALGGAESRWGEPVGELVYQYSGWYPIVSLFGNYGPQSYPNLVQDRAGNVYDYNETAGQAGGVVTIPLLRVDYELDLSLGAQWTDRRVISKSADDYRHRVLATTNLFEGWESAMFAELTFFNATAFRRSFSLEDGRRLSAAIERTTRGLGGDLDQTRTMGEWIEYVPMPLGENHVLRLDAVGGAGWGDEIAQGFFGLGGYGVVQQAASPGLNRNTSLRGYQENAQVGAYLAKAGAAYRFPIFHAYRGVDATLPFYGQQLFGELYYEGGHAWGGDSHSLNDQSWMNAAGCELNLSMTVFRFAGIAPGLGIVYAFDRNDPNSSGDGAGNGQKLQLYLSIKGIVNF